MTTRFLHRLRAACARSPWPWLVPLVASILLAQLLRGQAAPAPATAGVRAVGAIGITVSDLDRALAFYTGVLRFERAGDVVEAAGDSVERATGVFGARVRTARVRLGTEELRLTEWLAPRGRPVPGDSRSNDRWFQHVAIVVSDLDSAYAVLRRHRVEHASSGPQVLPAWNPNAGGIGAFYFKDPDGHVLEVIHFPPGKGLARWQRDARGARAPLFLGIDHTAIVVADTRASLAWWRDSLGLAVAGESENWGTEQEHLNNVFGARLRITGLRAAEGPGIEFLEYLAPRDGRPYPADARANDLIHWETTLVAARGSTSFVRDPDGHAVRIVAPATTTSRARP